MKNSRKIYASILLALAFFIFAVPLVFAYDPIPFKSLTAIDPTYFDPTNGGNAVTLESFLAATFRFSLIAAGVLALIMISIGGLQYMSTDAISSKSEGKERIKNAIYGLLLAYSSYLILNIINPDILSFKFFDGQQNNRPSTLTIPTHEQNQLPENASLEEYDAQIENFERLAQEDPDLAEYYLGEAQSLRYYATTKTQLLQLEEEVRVRAADGDIVGAQRVIDLFKESTRERAVKLDSIGKYAEAEHVLKMMTDGARQLFLVIKQAETGKQQTTTPNSQTNTNSLPNIVIEGPATPTASVEKTPVDPNSAGIWCFLPGPRKNSNEDTVNQPRCFGSNPVETAEDQCLKALDVTQEKYTIRQGCYKSS